MPVPSEPVVVNTGPLLALSACGHLDLLHAVYSRVIVPSAVIMELDRGAPAGPLGDPAARPSWMEVLPLRAAPPLVLVEELDEGERAVIALARETSIARVLIDELRGRMVARSLGLQVSGSVGVLIVSKRRGLVPAVKPCLEEMKRRGIWLSTGLVAAVLREVGE